MKQIIDDVYKFLLEQKDVQKKLLDLASQKREAVIKNDTDTLTAIVGEEYLALSLTNKIEKQRLNAMSGAVQMLGKPAKSITVNDLLEYADERQTPLLAILQKELLEILINLKTQNDENKALVEMQLEYNDILLSAIGGSEDPLNNFYGGDGQTFDAQVSRGINLLDTEI